MALSVKADGVWNQAKRVQVKVSGAWVNGKEVWAKNAGVWKRIWQYFTAALNAPDYYGEAQWFGGPNANAILTATVIVTGGQTPISYVWSHTGTPTTVSGQGTSSYTLRLTSKNDNRSGTLKCVVTDASGSVIDTGSVPWNLVVDGA